MIKDSDTKVDGDVKPEQTEGGMAALNNPDTDTALASNNEPQAPKPNRAERRKMANNQQNMRKVFDTWAKKRVASIKKFKARLERLKAHIGKEEYKALVAIFTVDIPEVKDKDGKVTQPASSNIDYNGLLKEIGNLITLQRESRMRVGKRNHATGKIGHKRKRTTGRSSDRKVHRLSYKFLVSRNAEASAKGDVAGKVKVDA